MKTFIIGLALLCVSCIGKTDGIYYTPEFVVQQISSNEMLMSDNYELRDKIGELTLAGKIQSSYASRGENKSFKLVYETVHQAFLISEWYFEKSDGLPGEMSCQDLAYYLLTFSSKETDFNPLLVGKHNDSGIAGTLMKDYPRLSKKARKRGLEFRDDIKSIRTGLICCTEEFLEKIELSHGNIDSAIWHYNGNREYLKAWKARYKLIRG